MRGEERAAAWNDPSSKANALFFVIFPTGPFFSLLVLFLLFTSFWSISVLYLVWFFLDWDTPNQGEHCWACAQGAEMVARCLQKFFKASLCPKVEGALSGPGTGPCGNTPGIIILSR